MKQIQEIIDFLNENTCLDETYLLSNDEAEDFCSYYLDGYNWQYGASKIVIIPDNEIEDSVVKIPIKGDLNEDDESNKIFGYFIGANNSKNSWDYCLTEVEIYQKAKEEKLDFAFAKTEFYTNINGYPIYIQERAEVFDLYGEHSEEEVSSTMKQCNQLPLGRLNIDWVIDFIDYYDYDTFEKLTHFITKVGINDLHSDNVGYINGAPVIIDYSGFFS